MDAELTSRRRGLGQVTDSAYPVLINRSGGAASAAGADLAEQVAQTFASAGARAQVHILRGSELAPAIKQAATRHRRIAVGGGDGTIASVAQLLVGTETELAVLPLGTLNHFARDLGIPAAIEQAAKLAVHGTATAIDVGDVNGRVFVNNASVGLYPFMVKGRDAIRERRGWPKWLASVPAAYAALSRLTHHRLRIDRGQDEKEVVTPLLFVGNNRYSLESGSVGARASLTDGLLSVYAVRRSGRLPFLWFVARAAVGRVNRARDFDAIGDCSELVVRSRNRSIEIALDGEIRRLDLPLHFTIRRSSLRVVTPDIAGNSPRER